MGPNWGQQQRMRQQQQQQRQRQKQGAWLQQQQKKKQQAGKFNIPKIPKNKVTGSVPPVQMRSDWNQVRATNESKRKKRGCSQVISNVITLAFIGFVVYVVLLIVNNL